MRCPFCAHDDTQVKDSRPAEDNAAIRRRRQCGQCGARFTSFERVQLREVTVAKSDGKREPFDRGKLERSLTLACRKRGVAPERIDQLVSGIQRQVETAGDSEVSSERIGELVMEGLRQIDPVAYIRFASVYRDFSEPRDFEAFASSVQDAKE
ncbi:MAG: transcriptional regulator NrdR [Qipengyuania sp.]|jgi:transcriptional repressor NrdR|nr:transcriptional regulator NrdR [Qipengyuania sp.]